jgi:sugar/nucleoside kinase (ribokinase family)
VRTAGGAGGTYTIDGARYAYSAAPLPGPVVDAYGCGDAFAAGLTFALGAADPPAAAVVIRGALRGRGAHGPRPVQRPAAGGRTATISDRRQFAEIAVGRAAA